MHWTVRTRPRPRRFRLAHPGHELLRSDSPVEVGDWLQTWRAEQRDPGFEQVVVREHPAPGIEPVRANPHVFIDAARTARASARELAMMAALPAHLRW